MTNPPRESQQPDEGYFDNTRHCDPPPAVLGAELAIIFIGASRPGLTKRSRPMTMYGSSASRLTYLPLKRDSEPQLHNARLIGESGVRCRPSVRRITLRRRIRTV